MKICVVSATTGSMNKLKSRLGPLWNIYQWKVVSVKGKIWNIATVGGNIAFKPKVILILEEIINFVRLFFNPGMYEREYIIVCENYQVSVLLFGKWLQLVGIPKRIYVLSFYIHSLYNNNIVLKILGFLLDQHVGLMAFSASDRDYVKKLSSAIDVRFSPYCNEIYLKGNPSQIREGCYVFAGGYSNRDYNFLIRCAVKIPDQQFKIICSRRNIITEPIPSNVEILKDIHPDEFYAALAGCKVHIVPLRNNVGASGQSVTVAAMQFAKPTLYPNYDIVGQYFENGVSGLMYQPGDIDSLVSTFRSVLENHELRHAVGKAAQKNWETNFRPAEFEDAIFKHITDFFCIQ